jgi:hypothetical protein
MNQPLVFRYAQPKLRQGNAVMESPNWLYQWIDEYDLRTAGDIAKASRKPSALDRLHELSVAATAPKADDMSAYSVVAGSRFDLSGALGCSDYQCIVPRVERVFGRIWHYFDTVVIDDVSADDISNPMGDYPYAVIQRAKVLLYLRQIGAEPYIEFAPKPRDFCALHFREQAAAEKLEVLFDADIEAQVVDEIVRNAKIRIDHRSYGWAYSVKHPDLEEVLGTASHSDDTSAPSREQVAREVFGRCCNALVADISTSQSPKVHG